jgi:hypothetical protein
MFKLELKPMLCDCPIGVGVIRSVSVIRLCLHQPATGVFS